jgi:diguanylate cyclase (GGDEF)-like protein/PAS domain S-box-containing protein
VAALRRRPRPVAGPDRSALPNLPELSVWVGALLFTLAIGAVVLVTTRTVGLPYHPWTVVACAAVLGAISQPGAQRWIGGGRLENRAALRICLAVVTFAVIAVACGSPFMVPVYALIVASIHLHWSGWRAWRAAAVCSTAVTVAAEALVEVGWLPAALSIPREHAFAAVSLGVGTQALANLGATARRREQIEQELRRTESRFRSLVDRSQDFVAILAPDWTLEYVSPSIRRFTRRHPEELIGRRLDELLPSRTVQPVTAAATRVGGGAAGSTETVEIELAPGTGDGRWLRLVISNQLDDPAVAGFVVNGTDVTDSRRYREQLVHAATHDPLTGLLNRAAFVTELQRELATVSPQAPAWLVFCDLDGFKQINDTLGHDAGDAVLQHAARRLRLQADGGAVVGRFGGDEFTVLLRPGSTADPAVLADQLAAAVAEPCPLAGGRTVVVGVSCGLVTLDGHRLLADDVLREADQRMYERKRRAAPAR